MDINTAIILNSQYNDVLAAIDNLQDLMQNVDIDRTHLIEELEQPLEYLEAEVLRKKHELSILIKDN